MRIGRDVTAWVVAFLVATVGLSEAQDAKPAPANPTGGLFQSLSLGSGKGPVRIDSDALELDYKSSNVTYRGHVQVTQGDVTLNSDTLSISYDPRAVKRTTEAGGSAGAAATGSDADRIKEIVAEGHVRIRQGTKLAEGRRAVFDQAKQTFTLSEGAVLHDGPNQVAGERVIVYLKEERSVVEGGSNTRVKAVLYPRKEDGGAKATALSIQDAATPAPVQP